MGLLNSFCDLFTILIKQETKTKCIVTINQEELAFSKNSKAKRILSSQGFEVKIITDG
jgi:hypothetical protein